MLSIFTVLAVTIAAPFVFIRLERWWNGFITRRMVKDYNELSIAIVCYAYTWAEANQEITDFKYVWIDHPECAKYVCLLKGALDKRLPVVDFKKEFGIIL